MGDLATGELSISDELCRIFGLRPGFKVTMDPGVEPLIYPADLERVKRELERMRTGTDQDITDRRRADAERRRLLNRVYEAQEGQDRRLAAGLLDGHVQSLAAIGFKLEQARLRLGASGSPEVDELLWQVTKDLSPR